MIVHVLNAELVIQSMHFFAPNAAIIYQNINVREILFSVAGVGLKMKELIIFVLVVAYH